MKMRNGEEGSQSVMKMIDDRQYDEKHCFLCGDNLTISNSSKEHVIPRWIQKHCSIENEQLILLNHTSIQYNKLTVPCCKQCNNVYLSGLEKRVQSAILQGSEHVCNLDRNDIFAWIAKLYYGILHKELFLKHSRENPDSCSITDRDIMQNANLVFTHLCTALNRIVIKDDCPLSSVFIVSTQETNQKNANWDYLDCQISNSIGVRVGKVGMIVVFGDGGALESLKDDLIQFYALPLHPIQFRELFAQVAYKKRLMNRSVKYVVIENPGGQDILVPLPIAGFNCDIFESWNQRDYAGLLSLYTGIPLDENSHWTCMQDTQGNPLFWDASNFLAKD